MKLIKYLPLLGFFFMAYSSQAALDSLGVKSRDGKKFIVHKIEPKETLYSLSRRYHVSVNDILTANEEEEDGLKIDQIGRVLYIPYDPSNYPSVSKEPSGKGKKHTVKPGDTLYGLSQTYNVSVPDIKKWNDMKGVELSIGDEIWVSKPGNKNKTALKVTMKDKMHTVDVGETLYSLSRKYEVDVPDLKKWNNLKSDEISVGQKLIVGKKSSGSEEVVVEKEMEKRPAEDRYTMPVQTFHTVKNNETLKSIADAYGLQESDLKKWNDLKAVPEVGTQISIVPRSIEKEKNAAESKGSSGKIHVVKAGETLYRLAEMYGVKVPELRKWNSLSGTSLSIGQKLYVANPDGDVEEKLAEEKAEEEKQEETQKPEPVEIKTENPQKQDTKAYFTVEEDDIEDIKKVTEKGVAEVISGSGNTDKYLALHRTAKIGTIMQVRNDLNDQIVFVRVLGKLPDTGVDDKVVIRISKKAFEKLGGVDYKFPVEISYLPLKD